MKTLILGAGVSGLGAARLLSKLGNDYIVSDLHPPSADRSRDFAALSSHLVIGPQTEALLEGVDQVVVSPGIPLSIPIIQQALANSISVISEIDLALQNFAGISIGVTGTNGKSTTVELLAHLLVQAGKSAIAVGNLGITPCEVLATSQQPDILVLELSSYQLELCHHLGLSAAIFTSFAPDHLERHGDLRSYFLAKWKMAEQTRKGGRLVFSYSFFEAMKKYGCEPSDQQETFLVGSSAELNKTSVQHPIIIDSQNKSFTSNKHYRLPSWQRHNAKNLVFAALVAEFIEPDLSPDLSCLTNDFSFLPFRFSNVGRCLDQVVINDSKATNVEATVAAMSSMENDFYILLGGAGKGESYSPFLAYKDRIVHAFCFGATGKDIFDTLDFDHRSCHANLKEAVSKLKEAFVQQPAPILFSPGCASFDEFKNFEERGHAFNKMVSSFPEFSLAIPETFE